MSMGRVEGDRFLQVIEGSNTIKLELRVKGKKTFLNNTPVHIFPEGTRYEGHYPSAKCSGVPVANNGEPIVNVPIGRTCLKVYELRTREYAVARGRRMLSEPEELEKTITEAIEKYPQFLGVSIVRADFFY